MDDEKETLELALEKLKDYRNLCERAEILDEAIAIFHLEKRIKNLLDSEPKDTLKIVRDNGEVLSLEEIEEAIVVQMRPRYDSLTQLAEDLGMGRTTLYRKYVSTGIVENKQAILQQNISSGKTRRRNKKTSCDKHHDRRAVAKVEICFHYDNSVSSANRCQECLDELKAIPPFTLKHHHWTIVETYEPEKELV